MREIIPRLREEPGGIISFGKEENMGDRKDYKNMTTLCYIERDNKYLMMHRVSKEHDPNQGKWIGVGGHFQDGESPEECLLREVKEETGLTLTAYRLRGIVTFVSDEWGCEYMYLFTADGFEEVSDGDYERADQIRTEGETQMFCREGILEWVPKNEIFERQLWEGDKIFLDYLLRDEPFFSLKLEYRGDDLVSSSAKIYPF